MEEKGRNVTTLVKSSLNKRLSIDPMSSSYLPVSLFNIIPVMRKFFSLIYFF